jgi:uncharacterized membrane protein
MAPLVTLVAVTLLARAAGHLGVAALRSWPAATRAGLAAMFLLTASAHFTGMRTDLIRMVPPVVPNPALMVTLTGLCEIAGAFGLLLPRTRVAAAAGLILLMVAVLPANIHAANAGITLQGSPPTPLVPRILLQVLFIAAVWWAGIRHGRTKPG